MPSRNQINEEIESLSSRDFERVERFIKLLKTKSNLDESSLKSLYAEAGEEDRMLAEEGMAEYSKGLKNEDEQ